jgi:hypothetical protein
MCDDEIRESCGKSLKMLSGPSDAAVAEAEVPALAMFLQSLHQS